MFDSETRIGELTQYFYQWEKGGRGWQIYECPVEIEPPFEPFYFYDPKPQTIIDDGRRPSLFNKVIDHLIGSNHNNRELDPPALPSSEILPKPFIDESELIELQVNFPPDKEISEEAAEQFLLALNYPRPLSYVIIGAKDSIFFQLVCRKKDSSNLQKQLKAYFPETVITQENNSLNNLWDNNKDTIIVDFGLSQEFMLPLRTFKNFKIDPLISLIGALSDLQSNECALFQILFQSVANPWADTIIQAVSGWDGKGFFADAPGMLPLAKVKVSSPLFAVVLRIAVQSTHNDSSWEIVKTLSNALTQFEFPLSNELIPLTNDSYQNKDHQDDLLKRQSRRTGMILNRQELVSLVHLPSKSVQSEKLNRKVKKTKSIPSIAKDHQLILGQNIHAGSINQVTLSPDQRIKHTYVIGASRTGKTTLLLNMIIQDIKNGQGFGVLDPHGDLIDNILGHIPKERFNDVILIDPSDQEYPIGFNILSSHSEIEKNLLASDLVSVFKRLSTTWGDQMTSVLGKAILAFLESRRGVSRIMVYLPFSGV